MHSRRMRALVIDDDPEQIELMKRMLEKLRFQTVTATNGTEGIMAFQNSRPDIVFLDIMMPGIDGFVTLRKIRSVSSDMGIKPKIFMLTAKSGTADVMNAIKFGATDYLVKPIIEARLLEKLQKHVKL